jgi:sodium/hydrogen antiporter
MGAVIGLAFRYLMKFCERKNLIDRQSYVAQYISLALLTIGVCSILGTDDLLAAFSCGTAFAWDGFFNRQTEEAVFSSVIDLLFNIAAFVYVGAWMPFGKFDDAELTISVWRLIVIAILVLLLRRLPVMIALYKWIPDVKTFREALFSGHFGPMGIGMSCLLLLPCLTVHHHQLCIFYERQLTCALGAVFISTLAAQKLDTPQHPPANQEQLVAASIQPIVAFMVLTSIAVHGLSIPFFSLGRRVHSVSRTWSRHEPVPEWANQAKLVKPGEDIVINRDSDMEKGHAGIVGDEGEKSPMETEEQREGGVRRGSSSGAEGESATIGDDTQEGVEKGEARRVPFMAPDDGTEQKEENPPDGDETEQEWQEGADKIIERRRGPAEEVSWTILYLERPKTSILIPFPLFY